MSKVVSGNRIPLHLQVATRIEQRVRKGVYTDREPLPSFRTLSRELGVSLNVVQRAIYHLQEKRILVPHHGRGVSVEDAKRCKRTALLFGFIQPYSAREAFEQQVLLYAEEAFANRDNMMIVRSSQNSAQNERDIAEHLLNNGIQGILLWPVQNDPNGAFFQELSSRVPVVLVDRLLTDADLPAVVLDFYKAGLAICREMLAVQKRGRMLALIDDLNVSTYNDLIRGLQDQAGEMNRQTDVTIDRIPITPLIQQWNVADFSRVESSRAYVEKMLHKGRYDALFCPQEEFLDYVVIETGLFRESPDLKLASLDSPVVNTRSRTYNEAGILTWSMDIPRMISIAADLLQQCVLSRTRIRRVEKLFLPFQRKQHA
jgi:DNA-binding LacI/PurR family transcriptional regulator